MDRPGEEVTFKVSNISVALFLTGAKQHHSFSPYRLLEGSNLSIGEINSLTYEFTACEPSSNGSLLRTIERKFQIRLCICDSALQAFGDKGLRDVIKNLFFGFFLQKFRNLVNRIFSNILITNYRIRTSRRCKLNKLET